MMIELLRQVLDETELTEPRDIADHMISLLDSEERVYALREVLPHWVTAKLRRVGTDTDDRSRSDAQVRSVGSDGSYSARYSQGSIMRQRFRGVAGSMMLGDMTLVDVEYAAQERHDMAKKIDAWADKFDRLAQMMRSCSVATVGQLSPDDVTAVLS